VTTGLAREKPSSVVARVLDEVRRGATPPTIAIRTGLPPDLVTAVLTELVAAGVVGTASCSVGPTCGVAALPRDDRPVRCASCPLSYRGGVPGPAG